MSLDTQASRHLAAQLRTATRAAHHGIDHHPLLAPLVRPVLPLADYIVVLRAFASLYRILDPALAEARRRFCPDTEYRTSDRSGWLADDLAFFEVDICPPLPPWPAPAIDSAAELVGRLYVIEGSTLGGQVIARQLALSLGVGPRAGARFFHGHGEATQIRWQRYLDFAAQVCPPNEIPPACEAANRMFAELGHYLNDVVRHRTAASTIDCGSPSHES